VKQEQDGCPDEIRCARHGHEFHGVKMNGCVGGEKQRYPARVVGGAVAEDLFVRGLCLPSGTAMTNGDLDRVIETIMNSRPG